METAKPLAGTPTPPEVLKVPYEELCLRKQGANEAGRGATRGRKISGKKTFKLFQESDLKFLGGDLFNDAKVPKAKFDDDCQTEMGEITVT